MQIHDAPPPALARGPETAHPALERPRLDVVLACVDVSSDAALARARPVLSAAELVATLVPVAPAALYVLHAGSLVGESILACPIRGLPPERFRLLTARARARWRGRVEALCEEALASAPAGIFVHRGDPRRVVPSLCRRLQVDLVVLGRPSGARFGGFAPGGVASAVSRWVECDVLVVGAARGRAPTASLRVERGGRA